MKNPINLVCAALAATFALASAQAEVYIFDNAHQGDQSTTRLPWGESSTWTPEGVPDNGDYNFNLDAGSYTLMGWPTPGDWDNHYLTLANGTLTFTGEVSTHSGQINVDSGATLNLPAGSSFTPGLYSGAGMTVNVKDGGSMYVGGSVRLYSGHFAVANGGSLTFAPSNLRSQFFFCSLIPPCLWGWLNERQGCDFQEQDQGAPPCQRYVPDGTC